MRLKNRNMKLRKLKALTIITVIASLLLMMQSYGQQGSVFEKSGKAPHFNPVKSGEILFNQMTNPGTGYIVSHHFTTSANSTETSAAADDFDVPPGETWDIWSIGIVGSYFQNDPGGGDTLNIFFLADNNGMPGDTNQEYFAYTNFAKQ